MKSGIYLIVNLTNNKVYVGSAVDTDDRWRLHKLELNRNNHCNRHLQAAWLSYGESNFLFCVIELTENLLQREQFWIQHFNATNHEVGYNICAFARNRKGVKASDETRRKLSEAHKGHRHSEEFKRNMSERLKGNQHVTGRKQTKEEIEKRRLANTGKKRTNEAKAKMSAAQTGRIVSVETRLKMSIAAKNRREKERLQKKELDGLLKLWA